MTPTDKWAKYTKHHSLEAIRWINHLLSLAKEFCDQITKSYVLIKHLSECFGIGLGRDSKQAI